MIRKIDTLISLPATDVPRAVRFYSETLGLKAVVEVPENGFYIFRLPEGDAFLGVHRHPGPPPAADPNGFWFWLQVEQIAPVRERLSRQGVTFVGERTELGPGFQQPFLDSEGNLLRLFEPIREVHREILIDAAPATVFAAISDAAQIERWFSAIDEVYLERRVGGAVRFIDPIFGAVLGRVVALDPPSRLRIEFTQNWPRVLEFNLTPKDGGTRVEVYQEGFEPVRERDFGIPAMLRGVRSALTALSEHLAARA